MYLYHTMSVFKNKKNTYKELNKQRMCKKLYRTMKQKSTSAFKILILQQKKLPQNCSFRLFIFLIVGRFLYAYVFIFVRTSQCFQYHINAHRSYAVSRLLIAEVLQTRQLLITSIRESG